MLKTIIGNAYKFNTRECEYYSHRVDAGYYGNWEGKPKVGAVSVSVQLNEYYLREYLENIVGFGFSVLYGDNAEKEHIVYNNSEINIFKNRNGAFNTVIFGIPEKDFDKKIYVIPFVVVGNGDTEKRLLGKRIKVSIYETGIRTQKSLRWLGEMI